MIDIIYGIDSSPHMAAIISMLYVTEFQKINHFVTFDTLNISSSNKALHSTNRHCNEYRISQYHELPEIL